MSEEKFLNKNHSVKLPASFKSGLRAKLKETSLEEASEKLIPVSEKRELPLKKLALVASMVFCLLIGYTSGFLSSSVSVEEKQKPLQVAVHKSGQEVVPVKIEFDSPADFDDVEFEIEIPSQVSFVSDDPEVEDKKVFSWIGSLKEGANVIPFLVKGNSQEKASIFARIRKGGTTKSAKVTIQFNN